MEELVYVISGSPQVEPLRGKYRIDFLLDRCVEVAAQCSGYENPFAVVAVFLSRYGNGILTYNEASIEMFVRLSAEEIASQNFREYATEVDEAISRFQAKQTQRRITVVSETQAIIRAEPHELESQGQPPLPPSPEDLADPLSSVATASLAVSSALRKSLIVAGLSSAKEVLDFHIAKGLASLDGIGITSEQYILDAIASLTEGAGKPQTLAPGEANQGA
jgi:hypothetical protein